MSVHDSVFSPPTVSYDTSTKVESFPTLFSSTTPTTIQSSTLDIIPVTYTGPTSKSTVASFAFIPSKMTEMSYTIIPTSFSFPIKPTFSSVKTISTAIMTKVVTLFVGTTTSIETIYSTPKTIFSPFLSTTQQSSQGHEATTLEILSGILNSSLYTVRSDRITALTNTYSRTAVPESVLSSTPSDSLHTSLNIQVSPTLTSFKNTPGPTKCIKATTYLSLNTKSTTSLSENTSTVELIKGTIYVSAPVSHPSWTPSSSTLPSLTSFFFHLVVLKLSSLFQTLPPTSQTVVFPVLGTRTMSSNTHPLLVTSWKRLIAEDSQFPLFSTTHTLIATPNNIETDSIPCSWVFVSIHSLSDCSFIWRCYSNVINFYIRNSSYFGNV